MLFCCFFIVVYFCSCCYHCSSFVFNFNQSNNYCKYRLVFLSQNKILYAMKKKLIFTWKIFSSKAKKAGQTFSQKSDFHFITNKAFFPTCEGGETHLRIFGIFIDNLKNNCLLRKLLKWTNTKRKNFNIYNVPKILMIWSTVLDV